MDLETTVPSILERTDGNALQFTVEADWAQFRRIDTTTTKQTYHIMPRTTTTGLVAAILGLDYNSYHDLLGPENTTVAISTDSQTRIQRMARNEISTTDNDLTNETGKPPGVLARESSLNSRQQRLYQYLCYPQFTITIAIGDTETYETFKDRLVSSERAYTPYLGTTECLAYIPQYSVSEVEYTPERIDASTIDAVDSVVPLEHSGVGTNIRVERSPRAMAEDRTTTEFNSYAYHPDGESTPVQDDAPVYRVGDQTVVFY